MSFVTRGIDQYYRRWYETKKINNIFLFFKRSDQILGIDCHPLVVEERPNEVERIILL